MSIADYARPGDKIDITHPYQTNGKVYKSSVFDLVDENTLEIGMPTDGGRMVLFQTGIACSFFFYTQKGMYTCDGKVLDRYKKDGFYMLAVKITTEPKKYQRREFYRVSCGLDFNYYSISEDVVKLETTEALFEEIANPKYVEARRVAHMVDLSGGGIRFITDEEMAPGNYVLLQLRLTNDKMDQTLYLVTQVIETFRVDRLSDKNIVRGKFLFKDLKDRDHIVRYVFEEDRMQRKKENGD